LAAQAPSSSRTKSAASAAQVHCLPQTDVNLASPRIHNQQEHLSSATHQAQQKALP
jgi:hypothetical protein